MAQRNLSKRQQEILAYIIGQILEKGYPPTVREIGNAVKLKSSSSVQAHLDTLPPCRGLLRSAMIVSRKYGQRWSACPLLRIFRLISQF